MKQRLLFNIVYGDNHFNIFDLVLYFYLNHIFVFRVE